MKFIFPQLYDIRPRNELGDLDLARIEKTSGTINLRKGQFALAPMRKRRVRVAAFKAHASIRTNRRARMALREALAQEMLRLREQSQSEEERVQQPLPQTYSETYVTHVSSLIDSNEPYEPPVLEKSFSINLESIRQVRGEFIRRARIPRSFIVVIISAALLVPLLSALGSMGSVERSVIATSDEAIKKLELATSAMAAFDTDAASSAFGEAASEFHKANEQFSSVGFGLLSVIAELPLSDKLSTGKGLLTAGEQLAAAGESLNRAFGAVNMFKTDSLINVVAGGTSKRLKLDVGESEISLFESSLQEASRHLLKAAASLEDVQINAVPPTYRPQLERVLEQLPAIKAAAALLDNSAPNFSGALGMRGPRRYLILLQNSSELRPTGGFIGNVAVATVEDGSLTEFKVEDTYFLDGQLRRYTVPPKPIQGISSAWSLHDANWFRDFPTTARIVSEFFEQTGMSTPDGVIAVTSTSLEQILTATGPVSTSDGLTVNAVNFTDTLNTLGQQQRPGETTQVRAVAALLPAILERIGNADTAERATLFNALKISVAAGDIQIWLRDEKEENLARMIGVSGELPESQSDFLALSEANINGFKTDRVIKEAVSHETTIDADGSITNTLSIQRVHLGNTHPEDFYKKVNKTYLRILVPKYSELISAVGFTCDSYAPPLDYQSLGFAVSDPVMAEEGSARDRLGCVEVGEESGKTFFGGWTFVSPGETLNIRLSYKLPTRIGNSVDSYRLVVAKQPGRNASFSKSIYADSSWGIAWHDERLKEKGRILVVDEHRLAYNELFGIVLKRP